MADAGRAAQWRAPPGETTRLGSAAVWGLVPSPGRADEAALVGEYHGLDSVADARRRKAQRRGARPRIGPGTDQLVSPPPLQAHQKVGVDACRTRTAHVVFCRTCAVQLSLEVRRWPRTPRHPRSPRRRDGHQGPRQGSPGGADRRRPRPDDHRGRPEAQSQQDRIRLRRRPGRRPQGHRPSRCHPHGCRGLRPDDGLLDTADDSPELEDLAALPRRITRQRPRSAPTYRVTKLTPGHDLGAFDWASPATTSGWSAMPRPRSAPASRGLPAPRRTRSRPIGWWATTPSTPPRSSVTTSRNR